MGQLLHGNARTTAAVRRAIQHSQESIGKLADRYGLNPKTVAKWKKRSGVQDGPMGPKQPSSTVLDREEEVLIVAFRTHTLLSLGLPVCLAGHAASPNTIGPASVPSAAWHRPLAGHGRRQAAEEKV
jgi:hypothetical protein